MSYDDLERRKDVVTQDQFLRFVEASEAQRRELREMVREIKVTLVEVQRDIKCIHTTWDTHVAEYGPLLKDAKAEKEGREKLRTAIIEKSLTGAVWAMVVFVALASWDYIKQQAKQ